MKWRQAKKILKVWSRLSITIVEDGRPWSYEHESHQIEKAGRVMNKRREKGLRTGYIMRQAKGLRI